MGVNANRAGAARPLPSVVQDNLQKVATEAAAKSLGQMLWSIIKQNPDRAVRLLSAEEVEWLAVAAICGWIFKRAEQAKQFGLDAEQLISEVPPLEPAP